MKLDLRSATSSFGLRVSEEFRFIDYQEQRRRRVSKGPASILEVPFWARGALAKEEVYDAPEEAPQSTSVRVVIA